MTVVRIISEPVEIHWRAIRPDAGHVMKELDQLFGFNAKHYQSCLYESAGGQRQRIGIACALATNPAFILADKPSSVPDVLIQTQLVNLLDDLKCQLGLNYMFIAHDL